VDQHEFNRQLAEAARELASEGSKRDTLDKAVQMSTEIIEACELAGISVVHPEGIDTPTATHEELRRIDQWQYEIGEGPCLEALRQEDVITSGDLANDDRWPKWGQQIARELGVQSSLSYRLFTTGRSLGALNLFSRRTNAFTDEDVLDGLALAAHVAVALAAAMKEDQLLHGLRTRTTIGQAQGILMERFDIDADHAFDVLRRVSSQSNRKLRDVAAELVQSRRTPGAE
jgi:GAF domain-containing protein